MEALEDSICDVRMLYDDLLPQKGGHFLSAKGKLQYFSTSVLFS